MQFYLFFKIEMPLMYRLKMQFYLFFKIEMSLMYRITLVSGVQHSGQHFTTISLNNYQTTYKVIIILLTIFLMLYTTSP